MHHTTFSPPKDYLWLFKDSTKTYVDNRFAFSYYKESDYQNSYCYKNQYTITIWEFNALHSFELKDASINLNVNLQDIDISYGKGEILNSKSNPKTVIKYGTTFNSKINISLDNNSSILKDIESKNYKGFYGIVNRMAFTNEKDEDYIQFVYPEERIPTLLLLYKSSKGFYIIIVESHNAKYTFDETFTEIFNLKNE